MSSLDRIRGLAAKAEEVIESVGSRQSNHYKALLSAYRQCEEIAIEEELDKQTDSPRDEGELGDAVVKFCTSHCFHGRRHGPGEADECSICPIAPHALAGVELEAVDDAAEIERIRAERARTGARQATARMRESGTRTLATYNDPAPRERCMVKGDGD